MTSYDTLEASTDSSRPLEIYRFALGSQSYTYTSAEDVITLGGDDYRPIGIARNAITQGVDSRRAILNVTVPASNAFAQRYVLTPPGYKATLSVIRLQRDESPTFATQDLIYKGSVKFVNFPDAGETAQIAVQTIEAATSRTVPRFTFMGMCNHMLYDANCGADPDLFSFSAVAGTRYGFEARAPYSASDPRIELLSSTGGVMSSNDNADPGVRDARLDFYAPATGTYFLRLSHVGTDTDWGEYDLMTFQHPASNSFQGPAGLTATAVHGSDTSDEVRVEWLNASVYDSVKVYRDSMQIAVLPGSQSVFLDYAPRGLYRYEALGKKGGVETARGTAFEFAGIVGCHAEDDFESGAAAHWVTDGGSWGTTPISASGTYGFTDSPVGLYMGCPTGASGCKRESIAMFGVPALLPPSSTLELDQVCATEDDFDYCIIEVSTNKGGSWTELARYDMGSDPAWSTGVADPSAYRHASLDLSAFANQSLLVRFRLESDSNLEYDGWYVDNVHINDANCTSVVAVLPAAPMEMRLKSPVPNPSRGITRFEFDLPRKEERVEFKVYDALGRQVSAQVTGPFAAGSHVWEWSGRDAGGHAVSAGVYFVRMQAGSTTLTQKTFRLTH